VHPYFQGSEDPEDLNGAVNGQFDWEAGSTNTLSRRLRDIGHAASITVADAIALCHALDTIEPLSLYPLAQSIA
jgi:hypothetical protein